MWVQAFFINTGLNDQQPKKALLYDDKSKLLGFSKFDALGLLDLLRRILDQVSTSAKDVANWPNVSPVTS
jgi:hypothetical protein